MGYSLLRFVGSVDQHLRCPICSHALESPVLTPCGHTFCRPCLVTWLRESSTTDIDSPLSSGVTSRGLHSFHTLDISLGNRHVNSQSSSLSENLSQRVQPVVELTDHLSVSQPEVQIEATRERQPGHSGTCPECRSSVSTEKLSQVICLRNLVLNLEVKCEHSDRGCLASFPLERSDHHLQTCEFVPVTCFGCETHMNRSQMVSHQQICPALLQILQGTELGDSRESEIDTRSSSHRITGRSYLNDLQDDHRVPWLEAQDSTFDSLYRAAVTDRSITLNTRRNRTSVSQRLASLSSRSLDNTEPDISPTRQNSFDLERSKAIDRRNIDTLANPTVPPNNTTVEDLTLARIGPSNSTTGRPLSPVRRHQALQSTSHVSLALAQAGCAAQVSRLLTRIGALETQVGKLLDDLQEANSKNSVLNIEYRRIQKELLDCRRDQEAGTSTRNLKFDVHHVTGNHQPGVDIDQLSTTLAQNLLAKPSYVDSTAVFRQLRSCYVDNFLSGSASERKRHATHDLHVLLATAYASNWFNSGQRTSLGLWLQHVLLTSGQCRLDSTHA